MDKFFTQSSQTISKRLRRGIAKTFAVFAFLAMIVPANVLGVIIYDNGTLATGASAGNGAAAPAGTQWSEAQRDFGVTNSANTLAGVSCSVTTTVFRCADDFNVPAGQTWTINQVITFAYQTGFAGTTSPIAAATLQIWRGRPGDAGSVVVFGDTSTNRLASSTDSLLWRIFSSTVGTGANPPSVPVTNRRVWQNTINVSPAAVLTAGNYWIDWNTQISGNAAHFAPANTTIGTRGVPFSNARQFTGAAWQDVVDVGQFPTGQPMPLPVRQDYPFKLDGSVSGAPAVPRSRTLDFDGDNRTDFTVARAASAGTQTTWFINYNDGGSDGVGWGLGVGFAGADQATPADYDGDGKTDIAVWRPGAATEASFYILNSVGSTVSIVPFGQTGDDPSIVGDYDGDGKADPAVYRAGAAGVQSTYFYRGSLSNPGGNVTFVPFGVGGDRPIQGDFDGDGKFDFHVARNSGGNAQHYRSTNGTATVSVFNYGLFTDRFISGDFDADARFDLAAVRTNGANFDWYVLMSGNGAIFFEKYGDPASDYLTPGDYDGDNKWDISVWRGLAAGNSRFLTRNTFASPRTVPWGSAAGPLTAPDYPVANFNVR